MDRRSGVGVDNATVILEGQDTAFLMVTDSRGLFSFERLGSGDYRMTVRHLAYGEHMESVTIEPEAAISLRVLISQQAIELDPLVIEAMSRSEREDRSRGTMRQEVTREEIENASRTSNHLGDILRQTVPGLRVRDTSLPGARVCIEFRGRRSVRFATSCQTPMVILDGVRMYDPPSLYSTLDPSSIERIEVIPPAEAGLLYGSESAFGVITIETKVWRDREELERIPPHLRGGVYDWSLELEKHSAGRVFLASALGTAVGVAGGVAIARQCVEFDELATDLFASSCDQLPTAGAWASVITLPLVGAALSARYAGGTPLSRGKFLPAVAAGAVALLPGYALVSASQDDVGSPSFRVGQVFVLVGIPAAVTLADRLFRHLRDR
jgi:hypothetical protein